MGELQDRRDAQTRAELSDAAIALFAEHGYDETTMEQVATSVGVSRRTAYRHFANKEDLIFEQGRHWAAAFEEAIASREPGELLRDVCVRGLLAVSRYIEDHREQVFAGMAVVLSTPALRSRYARSNRDWRDRYVELFSSDPNVHASFLDIATLAGALVGGTDGSVIEWARQPGSSLVELTESMVKRIEPLWPTEVLPERP